MLLIRLSLALSIAVGALPAQAQTVSSVTAPVPTASAAAEEAETEPAEPVAAPADAARRAELNLLGQTNAAAGESRRNENVQFTLVDNNSQRELNIRLGLTATTVAEFEADRNYYSAEYGTPPAGAPHQSKLAAVSSVHGQLFYRHLNSVTSARSFFQVGGVKPARENEYGFGLSAPLPKRTWLQMEASQRKIRGQVNGNVLVPLPHERVPLSADPRVRAVVERFIAAFPNELPNRTEIDARMLNRNSPQTVDGDTVNLRLDRLFSDKDRVSAGYQFVGQKVIAFQLVRGMNPDTATKSHRARLGWTRSVSAATTADFTLGFDRARVLIVPDNNSVGPSLFIGGLANIQQATQIPIDRAGNDYRGAARLRTVRGQHTFTFGAEAMRRQLNGFDSDNHQTTYTFRRNLGNDAITNLRLGLPLGYWQGIGNIYRAFRNWDASYYAGDRWQAVPGLTLHYGLRWRPITAPTDATGLSPATYRSDWNNVGPYFGLAKKLGASVLRAAYGIHFGEIFQATYQQKRFSPPHNYKVALNDIDILQPLSRLDPNNLRGVLYTTAPDLVTPYSQQYNLQWETPLGRAWRMEAGYVGSRTWKLLVHWYENRARPLPGIPLTTETINDRRADPRYYDVRRVVNSGRAYFDAARVAIASRAWRGLTLDTSYWFSKNIDTGGDYLGTAYDIDSFRGASQSEDNVNTDLRGLSRFDQPHALLSKVNHVLPAPTAAGRFGRNWNLGAIVLLKSGTPFNISSGSDAPGIGNADGGNNDRVHIVDASILGLTIGNPDTSRELLPRGAFAFMQPGEMRGNIGRHVLRRGGIYNVNASLERAFRTSSELELRLRVESVNFFNTPQFAEPGNMLADPNFGNITNTLNDGRTFRFHLAARF
ncbi:MAG: hypothetical protein FJW31_16915 [Acidobacteria bacterium]|nr:hypothetical protein [Acidobacteriota bacterium]